jgi:hypothetical protein
MILERPRESTFIVTATAAELAALLAGARMALNVMENDRSGATAAARESLSAVLENFDEALRRLHPV